MAPPNITSLSPGKILFSLAVTLLILVIIFQEVQPRAMADALGQLGALTLAAGVLISLVLNLFQAAELLRCSLLTFGQRVTYSQALAATVSSLGPKMVLPGGLGVVVRVAYIHLALSRDLALSTAAIALIPLLKLGCMMTIALGGWALGADLPDQAAAMVATALAAMVAVSWAACRSSSRLLDLLATRWSRLRRLLQVLDSLRQGNRLWPLAQTMAHALLSSALEVAIFAVILSSMTDLAAPLTLISGFSLCTAGSKIPVAILGLGAREALILVLLSPLAPAATLLAASLTYSVITFIVPPLITAPFTGPLLARMIKRSKKS